DHDLAAAVRAAYRSAELALELGEQALLRVRTTPAGALVAGGGNAGGLSPLERQLDAGAHQPSLSLHGFTSVERELRFARGQAFELEQRLLPISATAANSAPHERLSPLNWILGGVLVAGSVPLLVTSIITLASDGDCARHDASGACKDRVHF